MTMLPTTTAPGAPIADVIEGIQASTQDLFLTLQKKPIENPSALLMSLALLTPHTPGLPVRTPVSQDHSRSVSSLSAEARGNQNQARLLGMLVAETIDRELTRLGTVTSVTISTTSWMIWIRWT